MKPEPSAAPSADGIPPSVERPEDPGETIDARPRPGLSAVRKLGIGVVFVVLVAALVIALAAREDSDRAATTAPTQSASTVAQHQDQPPALLNTGEDWNTIVRSLLAYEDWLDVHPRPELVANYMHVDNPYYPAAQEALTNLAAGRWRFDPPYQPLTVDSVTLTSRVSPDVALVFVRYGPTPRYRVVDEAGSVITDKAPTPGNAAIWTLVRDPGDGRWRIHTTEAS